MVSRVELDNPNNFAGAVASPEAISEANAYRGSTNTAGTAMLRMRDLRRLKEGQSGGTNITFEEAVNRNPILGKQLQGVGNINELAANQMAKWSEDEEKHQAVLDRSPVGLFSGTINNFAQQAWETIKDPGELAIGAMVGGIAALAAPVIAGGGAIAAAAGIIGEITIENAISEAFVYKANKDQFKETPAEQVAINLLAGTLLGGAIHGIGRGVKFLGGKQADATFRNVSAQSNAGKISDVGIIQNRILADNVLTEADAGFFRKHIDKDFVTEDMTLQDAFKKVRDSDDITDAQYDKLYNDMDESDMFESRRFYMDAEDPKPILTEEDIGELKTYNNNPDNDYVNDKGAREVIEEASKKDPNTAEAEINTEYDRLASSHKEEVRLVEAEGKELPTDEFSKNVAEVVDDVEYNTTLIDIVEETAACGRAA